MGGGSRKFNRKIKRRAQRIKYGLGVFLIVVLIGSSLNIAFAEHDLRTLLANWCQTKQTDSIQEIEKAIKTEQKVQTERLKEQLQVEIEQANKRLQQFTETEKELRVEEIRNYADDLITSIEIDDDERRK